MSKPLTAAAEPLSVRARSRCGPAAVVVLRYASQRLRLTPEAARRLAAELLRAADEGERLTSAEEQDETR